MMDSVRPEEVPNSGVRQTEEKYVSSVFFMPVENGIEVFIL